MKKKISHSNFIASLILCGLLVIAYGLFVVAKNEPLFIKTSNLPKQETLVIGVGTQSLKNNFSTIHFNAGGNDFGGGALWISTQKKLDTPKFIQTGNGTGKYCTIKLEGIYYNSQRGERLWPLDENSLASLKRGGDNYKDLQVDGGLYTNCGTGDLYSIYGIVDHSLPGEPRYSLAAGVNYDISHNRIQEKSELNCTLQLVNNKTAVGYLYDYQGGVGFVGGNVPSEEMNQVLAEELKNGKCVSEVFVPGEGGVLEANFPEGTRKIEDQKSLENLKRNLAVNGIIGFTNDLSKDDEGNLYRNFGDKSQSVRTTSLAVANAINIASRNAEQLCRGKWGQGKGKLRCFNSGEDVVLGRFEPGTTYVVNNGNLVVKSFMKANDAPVSVFINGGKLILPSSVNTGMDLLPFNDAGYPANGDGDEVSQANFLKGIFIVNGLVAASNERLSIQNKLYVHGKLLTLNTYDKAPESRKEQLNALLGAGNFNADAINYRDLFAWRCSDPVLGVASDGTSCKKGTTAFARASLGILDMNLPSPLTE